ncbi:MAG: tRNA (5-methylaminomethyl-2-thiouridine)(34)-methyltransferase MnmD [Bacteroidota bacterium]
MSLELHLTKDQSHTLYVPELDETYHSRNGAVEEAIYVYIGRGFLDSVNSSWFIDHSGKANGISILEIGFGTGLNAWLTVMECGQLAIRCKYHSLETVPLDLELIRQLNYTADSQEAKKQLYLNLHQAEWNKDATITSHFTLRKINTSLQDFVPPQTYDVIYFDAFAPEKQPELWTKELFQKLYDCLNENGVIVTYSSKGDIKRMWREIGFEVERLPGPPMKRHMLRGRKLRSVE